MWKFWRIAETAVVTIETPCKACCCKFQRVCAKHPGFTCRRGIELRKYTLQLFALRAYFVSMLGKILRHTLHEFTERRHAVARLPWKIRATVKRPLVARVEEHGQRPAATTLCQQLMRSLIDLVNVGAFFAIDLDIDKQLVHERRRALVFKRFVGHDVTPVTGGITN